ncbi:hypothetical protein [Methylophaga marina]|uniref:Uncharacterized protein n=1 Tax=Methylophaga marina TaxID=45495 RepID=A0ABN0TPM9_9GAMM
MKKRVTVTIKKAGFRATKTEVGVTKKGNKITSERSADISLSDDKSSEAANTQAHLDLSTVSKEQRCPMCGETITKKYRKHTKSCQQRIEKERKEKRAMFNAQLKKLRKSQISSTGYKPKTKSITSKKKKHGDIVLYSQVGVRNDEVLFCSLCKKKSSTTWRYTKSNKGPVDLCINCKAVAPRMKQKSRREGFLIRLPGSFENGKSSK